MHKRVHFLFFIACIVCAPSSILAQVSTQIQGYVKDVAGNPLIGSTVYLEGTTKGAATDIDGFYRIENVETGSYNLIASYIGYRTQTQFNVIVKSAGNPTFNFTLEEDANTLDEVVVKPDKNVISRPKDTPLSTQTLTAVELSTYPGGNNDVVQVAQSLPGISPSTGGFRNDLIIRGGAPNESVYYLDGVEIPNINHFSTQGSSGGPVGLLNVSFIEDVTLSASSFGAQYDNPLSGVLQFRQRDGDREKLNSNFRLSASEAAITMDGPLFKGDNERSKTTFIASVRRSYLQFLFELIGLPIRPDYYDYQYKLSHDIDNRNTLNLIGVGSIDDFFLEPTEDADPGQIATLEQAPFINQRTNTIGLSWRHRYKDVPGFMETVISNNRLQNEFSRYRDNENQEGLFFRNDSKEIETKLRWTTRYFLDDWRLSGGFNVQRSDYSNVTSDLVNGFEYDTGIDFYKYGLFASATRSLLSSRLDITLGLRTDADTYTEGNSMLSTLSPRLSLSYGLSDKWKLNGTVGRYFKIPPYTILGFQRDGEFVNQEIAYTRSDHAVVGVEYILSPASSIRVEGFVKQYEDYPVSVIDSVSLANKGAGFEVLGNEEVESVGLGRSYGVEFLFQQKLTKNFYGIFSYTYFFSEFTGFDRSIYRPSVWDSRNLISFTGGIKLKRNWELSSRLRYAGSTPGVPTDLDATLASYPNIVLDFQGIGEEELDAFNQLDFRVDKKWNFEKLSLNIFVDIQNILGATAPQATEYILARDEEGTVIEPNSLVAVDPSEGSLIPSIGIVVYF